ncbi:MAG TPA: type II toxin-antitoxin system VapC family toxin [Sulfuricella sp.]|nr:type II toxin-antitoxin system VapC family toxin [Sulfuricella sp.]
MRYLLDTNICIYLINRKPQHEAILKHMDGLMYGDILISSITVAELRYGVAKSSRPEQNKERFEGFIERFEIVAFDDAAAAAYGTIRAGLEYAGTPIGPLDTLIAAHALCLQCTLVTNNVREFERVPDLKIQNWAE